MKKNLITGLIILLPIALTLWVLNFLVNALTQPFMSLARSWLPVPGWMQGSFLIFSQEQIYTFFVQATIVVAVISATILLGLLTRLFLINTIVKVGDHLLHRIPLVKSIYKVAQDVVQTLFQSEATSFTQVVMAPYPQDGSYSLGLVVQNAPRICRDATGEDLLSVFVPTTPNPTSGFLIFYPRSKLIFIDITVEDAMKSIISCGVIDPEKNKTRD